MDYCISLTRTREFKGFCYGVASTIIGIFVAAAFTSSAVTFTAHNAVVFTKVSDLCGTCRCKNADCTPAPVVPAAPVTPVKPKRGDTGVLGDLRP